MAIEIRPLRAGDEASLREAQADLARDDFEFAFGLGDDADFDFETHLVALEEQRTGRHVPEGWVPATYLVAVDGNEIVGRVSVRHELNDYLAAFGGHLGYGVKRTHRRRGIATRLLATGLDVLRTVGVERALVTCDDDNVASAAIIERAGGAFEGTVDDDGTDLRRYWIDL